MIIKSKGTNSLPSVLEPFAKNPGALGAVLNAMSAAGLPKVSVHLHSCESQVEGTNVNWIVKALEPACLKVAIEEPADDSVAFPPAEITHKSLSSYVVLSRLQHVEILFSLEYDGQANKFKGMLPQACMKQPAKLGKDVISAV